MIPQRLSAAVEKLARAMPRNPDVIELSEAMRAARVDTTAVDATPAPGLVVSTDCPQCQKRREAKRKTMQKYRAKS